MSLSFPIIIALGIRFEFEEKSPDEKKQLAEIINNKTYYVDSDK